MVNGDGVRYVTDGLESLRESDQAGARPRDRTRRPPPGEGRRSRGRTPTVPEEGKRGWHQHGTGRQVAPPARRDRARQCGTGLLDAEERPAED